MRKVVSVLFGALLASCAHGGVAPMPSTFSNGFEATPREQPLAAGYNQLYAFKSGVDAGYPYAGFTPLHGEFYGTTYGGGGGSEWGTVYKISSTGDEHVLYRFKAGKDAAHPYAGLIALNGELYGTTYQGGTSGAGTVFKIGTDGTEHVIYSFKGGDDGEAPYGALVELNGELYGTTTSGGNSDGWGTVFKVSPGGDEHVLYRFVANDNGTHDGANPYAGLIKINDTLYGTTYDGGKSGSGTIFKISTSGDEHVIYSFKGKNDGQYPYAPLLVLNGALYGTTYQGGASTGWGVVFKCSTSGTESVLYRFRAGNDGAHPQYGGLIAIKDTLYGTTYQGGASGDGTVFSVGTSGGEHVLYSFKAGNDGKYPYAGLTNLNGTLYGTTVYGGADDAGTVFKISP
jgi:uncharacterized repeat protein (TIGR03803 family)